MSDPCRLHQTNMKFWTKNRIMARKQGSSRSQFGFLSYRVAAIIRKGVMVRSRAKLYQKCKELSFESSSGMKIEVKIQEVYSPTENIFTWPASLILSSFLLANYAELVRGKCLLELGAGVGLPAIVAAKLGNETGYM